MYLKDIEQYIDCFVDTLQSYEYTEAKASDVKIAKLTESGMLTLEWGGIQTEYFGEKR